MANGDWLIGVAIACTTAVLVYYERVAPIREATREVPREVIREVIREVPVREPIIVERWRDRPVYIQPTHMMSGATIAIPSTHMVTSTTLFAPAWVLPPSR